MERLKELTKKYWYLLPLILVMLAYIAVERHMSREYSGRLGNPWAVEENHDPRFIRDMEDAFFNRQN